MCRSTTLVFVRRADPLHVREGLLESIDEAQHLVVDAVFLAHSLHIGAGGAQVFTRHLRVEVVLDVEVQAAVVPVHELVRVQVHVGEDLERVPADLVELVHRDESLAVVTEDELEVEESLDARQNHVEDRALVPRRQLTQQRDHPRPVQHDRDPLVPAPLDAVTIREDLVAADRDDERHERDVLDLDAQVLEDAAEEREQLLVLRPRQLPHLRVDELRRHVDGVRDDVMNDVFVVPPMRAHAEADGAEEGADELVLDALPGHGLVHAVVHDEPALLEEERDEDCAEHVDVEVVERDHRRDAGEEPRHRHARLHHVPHVVGLEEAALHEILPQLLKVHVAGMLRRLVPADLFHALQELQVVVERTEYCRRVLPDVLVDDRTARMDLLELRHVVPHAVDANRFTWHVADVDGTHQCQPVTVNHRALAVSRHAVAIPCHAVAVLHCAFLSHHRDRMSSPASTTRPRYD